MGKIKKIKNKENGIKASLSYSDKIQEKEILAAIGEGIIVCDAEGKIILLNHAALEFTGCSLGDLIDKYFNQIFSFFTESMNKPSVDLVAQVLKEKKMTPFANHTMVIKKDGRKIPVSDCFSPLFDDLGCTTGCVVVFRDITKEREIDKIKTDFVSIASHQLRTPLTGIQWLAEMLRNEKLTDKGQKYLSDIGLSVQRLNRLVELLLNTSRIQTGEVGIFPEPLEVVDFTKKLIDNLFSLYTEKQLSLTFTSNEEKIAVITDIGAFQNIVQVIFSNAIEYTPGGGKIKVRIGKHGQTFLLMVSDTGIGIPKKDQSRMFHEFSRASNASRFKPTGMGLGLWIAKQATELLGGKIWFHSEENEGSTFFVELPVEAKAVKGTKKLV